MSFLSTRGEGPPTNKYVFTPWIAEVEALTGSQGGKFSINVTTYLGRDDTSLSTVTSGVADIGMLFPDTFHLGSIGYLPFFFPDIESAAYATYYLWTEGNQTWARGELSGVKVLITSPMWPLQWWGNVEVRTPADLKDAKVNSWGSLAAIILALEAIPVDLGTTDLGAALQTGIVDGCLFPYNGSAFPLGIIQNTEYTTELDMFFILYTLAMNKAKYDPLPAEARSALDSVCGVNASVYWATQLLAAETGAKNLTISGPTWGRIPYEPTGAEIQLWRDATANVASDWIAHMTDLGFDGQGIYDRALELIDEYEASAS